MIQIIKKDLQRTIRAWFRVVTDWAMNNVQSSCIDTKVNQIIKLCYNKSMFKLTYAVIHLRASGQCITFDYHVNTFKINTASIVRKHCRRQLRIDVMLFVLLIHIYKHTMRTLT